MSARAAARKPGRSNLSTSSVPKMSANDSSDEEARAQMAALIDDLKEQLHKAETTSQQYQKQLDVLQIRLDEAVAEQAKLEEQIHEKDSKIEALNEQIREHPRIIREMQQAHDQELNALLKEKEQHVIKEEELQFTIQRLKESLAQREARAASDADKNVSRSSSFRSRSTTDGENGQFAPSSQLERSPSRSHSNLLLQKDKLIESLRLELAESQIKLVEMENKGGGRQAELERELLEARMANARLMEDNESYQLLLREKTLNGEFTKGDLLHDGRASSPPAGSGGGSLADELESAEGQSATVRKLEAEIKSLKEEKKALTLYIERIIGRLLESEGFEHILDKSDDARPPPPKTEKNSNPPPAQSGEGVSFLQRAKSVVAGQANRPRPKQRPASVMPASTISAPPPPMSAVENPETAPRVPIMRAQTVRSGHRRTQSEQTGDVAAAAVVGQMYRASRRTSGGPMSPAVLSPTTMGPGSRQSSLFNVPAPASAREPSQGSGVERKRLSSSDSVSSDANADVSSLGAMSTPPSRSSSGMNNYPGAVMQQNKLRPLRLVQENQEVESQHASEDEAAAKRANRSSWISWFNRPRTTSGSQDGQKS